MSFIQKIVVVSLVLAAASAGYAETPNEYYVDKGGSLVRVEANPNMVHPSCWQYWLYRDGAPKTGQPWAKLASTTLDGVIQDLKDSQQLKLWAKKLNANFHPSRTYFNEVGPVAVLGKAGGNGVAAGLGGITNSLTFGVGGAIDDLSAREADEEQSAAKSSLSSAFKLWAIWNTSKLVFTTVSAGLGAKLGTSRSAYSSLDTAVGEYGLTMIQVINQYNALRDFANTTLDSQIQQLDKALDALDSCGNKLNAALDQFSTSLAPGSPQALVSTLRSLWPSPMTFTNSATKRTYTQTWDISPSGILSGLAPINAGSASVPWTLSLKDGAVSAQGTNNLLNCDGISIRGGNSDAATPSLYVPAGMSNQIAATIQGLIDFYNDQASASNSQAVVEAKASFNSLKSAVKAVPKKTAFVSKFGATPKPIQELYAKQMNAIESGNQSALGDVLTPDFYAQDPSGHVTPRSKYIGAVQQQLQSVRASRVVIDVLGVQKAGNQVLVNARRSFVGPTSTVQQDGTETWITAGNGYQLQSIEPMRALASPPTNNPNGPASAKIVSSDPRVQALELSAENDEKNGIKPKAAREYAEAWRMFPEGVDSGLAAIRLYDTIDPFESARLRSALATSHPRDCSYLLGLNPSDAKNPPNFVWIMSNGLAIMGECEKRYSSIIEETEAGKFETALEEIIPVCEAVAATNQYWTLDTKHETLNQLHVQPAEYISSRGVIEYLLGKKTDAAKSWVNAAAIKNWAFEYNGNYFFYLPEVSPIISNKCWPSLEALSGALDDPVVIEFVTDTFKPDSSHLLGSVKKSLANHQVYLDGLINLSGVKNAVGQTDYMFPVGNSRVVRYPTYADSFGVQTTGCFGLQFDKDGPTVVFGPFQKSIDLLDGVMKGEEVYPGPAKMLYSPFEPRPAQKSSGLGQTVSIVSDGGRGDLNYYNINVNRTADKPFKFRIGVNINLSGPSTSSADGRYLACRIGQSNYGGFVFLDTTTRKIIATDLYSDSVAWTPDDRAVCMQRETLAGSLDNSQWEYAAVIWNLAAPNSGVKPLTKPCFGQILLNCHIGGKTDPNAKWFATRTSDGLIQIFSLETGTLARTLAGSIKHTFEFSADGNSFIISNQDSSIVIPITAK